MKKCNRKIHIWCILIFNLVKSFERTKIHSDIKLLNEIYTRKIKTNSLKLVIN